MQAIVPNLSQPMRDAILANQTIVNTLPVYLDAPTVFTRRPVPPDAPYPMIVISGDITKTDQDGIADMRPIITRDIVVYGNNDTADNYRDVEELAYIIYSLFHRERQSIPIDTSLGWNVTQVTCQGPRSAPTEDDQTVAKAVTIVTQLNYPSVT
jgi:hypothetical protein